MYQMYGNGQIVNRMFLIRRKELLCQLKGVLAGKMHLVGSI